MDGPVASPYRRIVPYARRRASLTRFVCQPSTALRQILCFLACSLAAAPSASAIARHGFVRNRLSHGRFDRSAAADVDRGAAQAARSALAANESADRPSAGLRRADGEGVPEGRVQRRHGELPRTVGPRRTRRRPCIRPTRSNGPTSICTASSTRCMPPGPRACSISGPCRCPSSASGFGPPIPSGSA